MSALSGTAVIAIAAMSLPGSINIAAHSAASHMKCRYIFFARVRIVVIRAIMVAMDAIVNSAHNAEYIFNPNGASAANVATVIPNGWRMASGLFMASVWCTRCLYVFWRSLQS